MAKDPKVESILKSIITGTKNGSVDWSLQNTCFNSETSHTYESYSIDKKTKFQMEVSLEKDFTLKSSTSGLFIFNENLVDGRTYLSSDYNEYLKSIKEILYENYIKPNITRKNESDVFDSILLNIGNRQMKRDFLLDEILSEPEVKVEPKSEPVEEKKKSIWDKFKI
jgi:hypothetical protein